MQQTSVQKTKKNQKKIGGMNMFKKMKHMKNEKGLTLIELLAVIVILAIIAAIAIPAIGNIINNQRDKAILSDISGLVSAAKLANADGACGDDNICQYDDLSFKSSKVTAGVVSLVGDEAKVTGLTITNWDTSTTQGPFKGKNATTIFGKIKLGVGSDASATGFTETELNELMGK